MKIISSPVRIVLIARTHLIRENLVEMLDERGLEWIHVDAEDVPLTSASGKQVMHVSGDDGSLLAEYAGRGCYNSFGGKNGEGPGRSSNEDHVHHLIEVGHGSVLEHVSFTFQIYHNSRGLTHELVRHRVGTAFSQASTRFRDESNGTFIVPPLVRPWFEDRKTKQVAFKFDSKAVYSGMVKRAVKHASSSYDNMIDMLKDSKLLSSLGLSGTFARKAARGIARSLLPIGLESPIVLSVNARAARNILDQRANEFAEAEIREMAVAMWKILVKEEPVIFGDYELKTLSDGTECLTTDHRKV